MGHEKMLGRDFLVGIMAGEGERQRDIYLPAGEWMGRIRTNGFRAPGLPPEH